MSKSNLKFLNNDEGVSPIVATLVLIVVAIVGAAAVGLIMGSFSSNVSKQANTGNTVGQASSQIIMGGSTTVQPLAQILAAAYMNNNTGVKISVQGGASTAGEIGAGSGSLDIGMASETVPATVMTKYPNIQTTTIGGSGIVVIVGSGVTVPALPNGFKAADILASYQANAVTGTLASSGITHFYTRAESSGTADAFAKYISGNAITSGTTLQYTGIKTATGNDGMLAAIQKDTTSIGYVDYGFAANAALGKSAGQIQVVPLEAEDGSYVGQGTYQPVEAVGATQATLVSDIHTSIKASLKDYFSGLTTSKNYPIKAVRPLNLLTNGAPSAIEQSIISFFQQPQNEYAFTQCGYDSMADIGV